MRTKQAVSPLWFLGPASLILVAAFAIVTFQPIGGHPESVMIGLSVDLVVLIPLVYFLVMVRKRGWSPITVIPVFLLCFGAASLIVPQDGHALLDSISVILPVIEVLLLAFVGTKAFRLIKVSKQANLSQGDFYENLRTVIGKSFGAGVVANILAYEISVFYFAFSFRRRRPDSSSVTYHLRSGYGAIVAAVFMAAAVELTAVHFLLRSWSMTAAVIHAALSVYGLIWLTGDYRSMSKRPHELDSRGIRIRNGLRWTVELKWNQIASAQRVRKAPEVDGYLNLVPFGSPRYIIKLRTSESALGPYGIEKQITSLGFRVDDEADFEARLRSYQIELESQERQT